MNRRKFIKKTGAAGLGFRADEILKLGPYMGYRPLIADFLEFFRTGLNSVDLGETLEIYAFMVAADGSKSRSGEAVDLDEVIAISKS